MDCQEQKTVFLTDCHRPGYLLHVLSGRPESCQRPVQLTHWGTRCGAPLRVIDVCGWSSMKFQDDNGAMKLAFCKNSPSEWRDFIEPPLKRVPDSTSAASRFSYVMTTFSCFEEGNFSHKLTHSDGVDKNCHDHGVASLCFPKDLPAETAPASVAPAIAASLQLRCCAALRISRNPFRKAWLNPSWPGCPRDMGPPGTAWGWKDDPPRLCHTRRRWTSLVKAWQIGKNLQKPGVSCRCRVRFLLGDHQIQQWNCSGTMWRSLWGSSDGQAWQLRWYS